MSTQDGEFLARLTTACSRFKFASECISGVRLCHPGQTCSNAENNWRRLYEIFCSSAFLDKNASDAHGVRRPSQIKARERAVVSCLRAKAIDSCKKRDHKLLCS